MTRPRATTFDLLSPIMPDILDLTLDRAREALVRRELSSVELTRAALERIAATEPSLHALITPTPDLALQQAADADRRLATGSAPALCGIPVAVKDNILTAGVRTTAASRILADFVAPYESTCTQRLREAGAVLVGKANCDEFAMGSSTESSAFGVTHNPWQLERVPGGSSGGSAASVAAGQCLGALGTDTGGSIRQPAAFCGVVGLKPTYGRVSRYGVIAFASSLDQVGPIGRTAADCASILTTIAGHDPNDSTTATRASGDYRAALRQEVAGLTIGLPKEYFVEGTEPAVDRAVREAVRHLVDRGARVEEVTLPHSEHAIPTYYLIATAEASSNLSRYDGVRYGLRVEGRDLLEMYRATRAAGFGAEVKRRIMLGTYALSAGYYDAYYLKAQKVRTLIRQDFLAAFRHCDLLLTPTTPTTAFRIGDRSADPLQMYLGDIFTVSINLAGLPAISVPCGFDESGLPIGFQLVGRPFDEQTLLDAAHAYETSVGGERRRPPI